MISKEQALKIANQWVEAWNRRDLEAILSHYSDDVELTSPIAAQLLGNSTGEVQGKAALKDYFSRGLANYSQIQFTPLQVFGGVNSLVVYYRRIDDRLAAEFMEIGDRGLIVKVNAHYSFAEM